MGTKSEDLYKEMMWQKKLRDHPALFWISRHFATWEQIALYMAIIINLLVAFFYPFSDQTIDLDRRLSLLIWFAIIASFVITITVPRLSGIQTLTGAVILRLIFSVGVTP